MLQTLEVDLRHLDNDLHAIMKSGEEFQWDRVPFVLEDSYQNLSSFFASQKNMFRFEIILCVGFHLYGFGLFVVHMEPAEQLSQATGKTMDSYMSEHQDRSRNALQKAAEASFLAWCEELKADQAQFLSEKILCLGCAICNTYYRKLLHPTVFERSYAKITQNK